MTCREDAPLRARKDGEIRQQKSFLIVISLPHQHSFQTITPSPARVFTPFHESPYSFTVLKQTSEENGKISERNLTFTSEEIQVVLAYTKVT